MPAEPWRVIDLSHVFDPARMSVFPGDPLPELTEIATIPVDGYRLQAVRAGEHTGTHWGAPAHFDPDGLTADQLDETALAARLYTADLPEPDLLIRTGGDQRISNFLIWQAAYAELYFCDRLWPDFDAAALDAALDAFALRSRRFGR
jgi:undecaprenyl diphosphate synthase